MRRKEKEIKDIAAIEGRISNCGLTIADCGFGMRKEIKNLK
jgi:hypothetical protein